MEEESGGEGRKRRERKKTFSGVASKMATTIDVLLACNPNFLSDSLICKTILK